MSLDRLRNLKVGKERPLLCLEVNPVKGVDLSKVLGRLEGNLSGIDFFNVTDSALARMRMSALPFASVLKAKFGVEPLVNISCRDRNLIALQADLLAGWVTGVRSVVALTGDAMSIGDSPDCKGVFEVNSIGLLDVISKLNSGKDLAENDLHGAPDYCAGVVVNPNAKNVKAEVRKLERKIAAGAKYALSQPVFSKAVCDEFFLEAEILNFPIFLGLMPIVNAKAALGTAKVPGIKMAPDIVEMSQANPEMDLREHSIKLSLEIAQSNVDRVCGFHIISGTHPLLGIKLARRLAKYIGSL